ncbi:MAG: hypothetical protein IBJ09_07445 [Bacteroidia bacterium]|nr:hypothetical protein [Bacteroidia bacterium]
MSFSMHIFRKEVQKAQEAAGNVEFFEDPANLLPFTEEQKEQLSVRLGKYNYRETGRDSDRIFYEFDDGNAFAQAMLTAGGLYFSASGEGIFEIAMTSSEFTDSGEFAKYDPQEGGWEEEV